MPLGAQVIVFCLGVGVEQFVNLPMIVVAGLSTLLKSQNISPPDCRLCKRRSDPRFPGGAQVRLRIFPIHQPLFLEMLPEARASGQRLHGPPHARPWQKDQTPFARGKLPIPLSDLYSRALISSGLSRQIGALCVSEGIRPVPCSNGKPTGRG